MSRKSVLIAGAGIGGLTTALCLRQRGIDVTVLERARELAPLGVGINLLPHAVRELDGLGLGGDLAAISVAPSVIAFFDYRGGELFREARGIEGGYGYPQLSVHRGQLQMLLLDAVVERIGSDTVRTGAGLTGFEQNGRHRRRRHQGRSDGRRRTRRSRWHQFSRPCGTSPR